MKPKTFIHKLRIGLNLGEPVKTHEIVRKQTPTISRKTTSMKINLSGVFE